jgi:ABC-type phosphate transport system permease subunit
MPLLFAAMKIFLLANVVGLIVRIFVAFGLNIILVQPAVDAVTGILTGQLSGLPSVAIGWVTFFNVHRYIGLILSGYAVQQGANFVLRINR